MEKGLEEVLGAMGLDSAEERGRSAAQDAALSLAILDLLLRKGLASEQEIDAVHALAHTIAGHLAKFQQGLFQLALAAARDGAGCEEETIKKWAQDFVESGTWLLENTRAIAPQHREEIQQSIRDTMEELAEIR